MKQRCYNPKLKAYKYYGARGITVCDEWLSSFQTFLNDLGRRPVGFSLERKDVNKGYFKENCCWATTKWQAANTRRNRLITYAGRTQNITQWANEFVIFRETIAARIRLGRTGAELFSKSKLPMQRVTKLTYLGRTQTVSEWARELGYKNPWSLYSRINRGDSIDVIMVPRARAHHLLVSNVAPSKE
jgi:hypothetical protein